MAWFAGAAIGSILAGALKGAIIGAIIGGISAAITGGSIGSGVLFGAIGGAITGGLSGYFSNVLNTTEVAQTGTSTATTSGSEAVLSDKMGANLSSSDTLSTISTETTKEKSAWSSFKDLVFGSSEETSKSGAGLSWIGEAAAQIGGAALTATATEKSTEKQLAAAKEEAEANRAASWREAKLASATDLKQIAVQADLEREAMADAREQYAETTELEQKWLQKEWDEAQEIKETKRQALVDARVLRGAGRTSGTTPSVLEQTKSRVDELYNTEEAVAV